MRPASVRWLSTRDLAEVIGVSESTLKRWVDAGKIAASRTEGGHRRIELGEALRFVRASGIAIVRPELLDLSDVVAARDRPHERLLDHLLEGDAVGARGWLTTRYLQGASVAELGDGPIRDAMHSLGELWHHEERGVFVEHRATECCLDALSQLRAHLPEAAPRAPCALGGAPAGDPYILPSQLATLVAAEAGMRAVNLGPDVPIAALECAVGELRPSLVWICVSSPMQRTHAAAFAKALDDLSRATEVIIGGREAGRLATSKRVHRGASMADLATIARTLTDSERPPRLRKASPRNGRG